MNKIFLYFLLFSCLPLFAQTTGTISGYIKDKSNGETLPFANIVFKGTKLGTSSNKDGYYAIPNLPYGTYQLSVSLLGYKTKLIEIEINKDIVKNFELESEAIQAKEVVVSAERIEQQKTTQTSRIIMQAEDLKNLPAIGESDVFRALQLMPGVKASSDISSGLYVRGGGPDQNLILIDGTIVYNPSHLFGFFSTFNTDAVKDIELMKGGFPAEYGGRLSSVLNVTNKDGNRINYHGKGSVSLISSRLTAEGPVGNGSFFLSGRRTYFDVLVHAAGLDVGKDPLPLYYFYDANGKINQEIDENNKIAFVGYLGNDNLTFNQNDGAININLLWGNNTGSLKYTHIFNQTLFSNLIVTGSSYKSEVDGGLFNSKFLFENTISDYSVKGDVDYFYSNEHFIKAGFWWSQYRFGVKRTFAGNEFYNLVLRPANIATYIQDEWNMNERWNLSGGLRFEYQDASKQYKLGPRFSSRYNLTEDVSLKFASGVYYQTLNLVTQEGFSFVDLWIPLDDKMVPSRAIDFILGTETHPFEGFDFNIEAYYKQYKNIVELKAVASRTSEINQLFNLGDGDAYGAEFFFQKKIGQLSGFIGYSLAWTNRTFAEINNGKTFQPKYDRRHDISVVANYQLDEHWKFGAIYTYATGQTYTAGVGRYAINTNERTFDKILAGDRYNRRLEPYYRLDFSVTKRAAFFGMKGSWYIQIFNVFNHRNVWFKQFDTTTNPVDVVDVRLLPIIPTFGLDFEF